MKWFFLQRIPAIVLCVSPLTSLSQPLLASPYPNRGKRGMVVSAQPLASEAGLKLLKQGGNAIDAAVATTLAISVVEPYSAGIGGGGFLLVRLGKTGELRALDFRERAPLAATQTMFLDSQGKVRPNASTDGYLAAGVPGTVAGLYEVHQRYGKLPWKVVVAPAIQLAAAGFPVSGRLAEAIGQNKTLQQNAAAQLIFTRNGQPLQPGDVLAQRDLAKTLQAIAADPQSFYTGSLARAIARDIATNKGLMTLEDLKRYRAIWREPVCGDFRATRICSMPPPSSGGVHLLQILNLIGTTDLKAMGWHNVDALHLLVEAMKIAYADRSQYLGDPDFVKVPVKALISRAYADQRRREIDAQTARPSDQIKPGDPNILQRLDRSFVPARSPQRSAQAQESIDTSHLSVVDAEGNAVSLTFTINLGFGAGVVAAGTGIILNNEMDDFAIAPNVPNAFGLVGGEANAIAPGKTPLSSMTPTIVTEKGQLRLVTGAPGGSTIITTVLQIVLNVLVYDMDARRAVAAPRIHHQWLPDKLRVEPFGLDRLTVEELQRRGHAIETGSAWGNADAIVRLPNGQLEGAADPRGDGAAIGF